MFGSGALLAGLTAAAILAARRRPYILVGWLWYVITLIPVIGLVQVGKQAMADRYTYVPLIGLFVIIAWGVPDLLSRSERAQASKRRHPMALPLAALSVATVAVLMAITYRQAGYWRDSVSLCTHAIQVNDSLPLAHLNLGTALAGQGDVDAAIAEYPRVIELDPGDTDAHYDLATALANQGNDEEAIAEYRYALRVSPKDAQAYNNFGVVLARSGHLDEAIVQFKLALALDPENTEAQRNLDRATGMMRNNR